MTFCEYLSKEGLLSMIIEATNWFNPQQNLRKKLRNSQNFDFIMFEKTFYNVRVF